MRVIRARNVNDALTHGLMLLSGQGMTVESRNGPAVKVDMPVSTVTERPRERVLYHAWRDANPFFHFYESLWMLAGRRDIKPLTRFVARMADYSDNGETQNAAYGHRWRYASVGASYPHGQLVNGVGPVVYERDQLKVIVDELRSNRQSRQCVLQIWEHTKDLGTKTKDHACNIAATFQIDHYGHLEMVVFCRSNDAIWGCHGANAVHFSVLMEYVASCVGVPVGAMTQVSVNYHAYADVFKKMFDGYFETRTFDDGRAVWDKSDPYSREEVKPFPLMQGTQATWDEECRAFVTVDGRAPGRRAFFTEPFFRDVAWPIVKAHDIYKDESGLDKYDAAIEMIGECHATDWMMACVEWLTRRLNRAVDR